MEENLNCASIEIELNNSEHALKYLESGLEHYLEFRNIRERIQFEAPLINKVKNYSPSIVLMDRKWLEDCMQSFPAECVNAIKNNPKYASIFTQ